MALGRAAPQPGNLMTTRESGQTLLTEVGGQVTPIGSIVSRGGGAIQAATMGARPVGSFSLYPLAALGCSVAKQTFFFSLISFRELW